MTANKNTKKSPFPGMDPYLEQHWGDVHTSLMVYIRNQINAQLPDELQARVEESTAIQIEDEVRRVVFPDVRIVEDQPFQSSGGGGVAVASETVSTAKPIIVKMELDTRPQRTVEIVDVSSNDRVVTAIEVLSPSNKIGNQNRLAYQRKRYAYIDSRVNLVEIDLIRDGEHIVAIPLDKVPKQCWGDYITCVQRDAAGFQFELYPMPLRQPLPDINIPLRRNDKDVLLQIQTLIDQCYQDGRYWRTDYSQVLRPRLSELDKVWADALIANVSQGHA